MYRMSDEPKTCNFPVPYWLLGENGKGSVAYFVYGRFQPGHKGHQVVFKRLVDEAKKGNPSELRWVDKDGKPASNVFVFVSQKQNNKRKKPCSKLEVTGVPACENPLDPDTKVNLLETQNPTSEPHIHFMKLGNILAGIPMLLDCYEKVVMFVGEDRVGPDGFGKLKKYYPGRLEVESAGERDPDSGDIDGMSSSKIRRHAVNIKKFDMGDNDYKFVRDNLGVDKKLADVIINKINAAYTGVVGGRRRKKKTRRRTRKHKRRTRSKKKNKKGSRKSRKR